MKKVLLMFSLLQTALFCFAQSGVLDNSFGANGLAKIGNDVVLKAKQNPADGKIYAIIYLNYLGRLNNDGTIDNSFGNGGIVNLTGNPFDIIFQSSGKVVIAEEDGNGNLVLERFSSNGTLDNSFQNSISYTDSLHMQSMDGITLFEYGASKKLNVIISYETPNFGYGISLLQTDSNGIPDITYSSYGIKSVLTQQTEMSYVQAVNNEIVIAGNIYIGPSYNIDCRKYNHDLQLINSFGNSGSYSTSLSTATEYVSSIGVDGNGSIFIGCSVDDQQGTNQLLILKLTSNGNIDNSFGVNGKFVSTVGSLTSQPLGIYAGLDGKVSVFGTYFNTTGKSAFSIRVNQNGTVDNTYGISGKYLYNFPNKDIEVRTTSIQQDGKVLVTGFTDSTGIFSGCILRVSDNIQLGLKSEATQQQFEIYPNPTKNKLVISFEELSSTKFLTVQNTLGEIVYKSQLNQLQNTIDVSNLETGIYFLRLQTAKGLSQGKRLLKE